ncbi:MAG: hypothetical protein KatS3mg108_3535 [Isosphaeraceae bacterium]|jgi:hypothetical protein|nr:MAG: hypothetical protein KatS3mg108_3535 [Isosphaeraceae bacterium]
MKIDQFLEHHGITLDPFSEEDAQTDTVFKRGCLRTIHHPAWTKFFGSPSDPSTAIVFGEKGSGKTALRLQVIAEIERFNQHHPDSRVFVISYDDFNPLLDHLKVATNSRSSEQTLARVRLADHMDAILSLGVTRLIDLLRIEKPNLSQLPPELKRDALLLAALYDQSTGEPLQRRWNWLRRQTRFRPAWQRPDRWIAAGGIIALFTLLALVPAVRDGQWLRWLLLATAAACVPLTFRWARSHWQARSLRTALRVLNRDPAALRHALVWFNPNELAGQPLPDERRGGVEERYELLRKFQSLLAALGYTGVIVVIDRVDEPQLIEGDPRRMRALVWPLLDHKFLRHPGLGVKLLLPIEMAYYLEKEDKAFYDRARPDKLNLIKPLRWSGASLYDLAGDRLRVCAGRPPDDANPPRLRQFLDASISDDAITDALHQLRTPRQLFKFLNRLLQEHCHRHTEDKPRWTIDADTFRSVFQSHLRDLEAFDRGFGHG